MKKIVIASACRTAIGKFGGTLKDVPAADLGSIVIKEAIARAGISAEHVDHVYMGCVIQAGQGQNVARQAALKAGLPIETPAVTVNVVCGSGLNCVNMAAQMIEAGDADIVVAGGMENMDLAPFALMKGRYGYRMGSNDKLVDTMVNDALWDACGNNVHMGITAENICVDEKYQQKYGYSPITREMLDEFAYNSQVKADAAIKAGAFKDEIVPVVIPQKKGDPIVFDTDEYVKPGTTMEKLAKLKPAFKRDGGTGLAAQGQLILHLAGDAVLFGHVLGGDAHVAVVERIPQAVVDHHVGHGGVVHAGAPAGGIDGVGSHAHALHTAGHDALSLAGHDGAVSDGNAVQTGAAHLVQGGGGGLDGQTGLQGGLTGGVLAQTSLQHVAEEQLVDLGGLDAAALQGFLDDQGAQFNGGGALQRAAEAAHSGTSHAYQINFFHVNTLLLYLFVC